MTTTTCILSPDDPVYAWRPNLSNANNLSTSAVSSNNTIIATTWSNDSIIDYSCQYREFQNFKRLCASAESHAVLVFGLFGFLGGLFTIATLTQKSFRVSDFFLFRIIGYLETIQMAVVCAMSVLGFSRRCDASYYCTFFWAHIATTVTNVCADGVDLIVLFLSIERTVACVLPHYFHLFHSTNCWLIVTVWSLALPLIFSLFQAFELRLVYDELDERWIDLPSEFAHTSFYELLVRINTARFYVTASLIALATICSVVGFSLMANRKRKLIGNNHHHQQKRNSSNCQLQNQLSKSNLLSSKRLSDANSTSDQISPIKNPHQSTTTFADSSARRATNRLQRDLCCLQLCLAIPVVINHLMYAMGLNTTYSFVIGKEVFTNNLTVLEANDELNRARSFIYLRLATNLSNVLGHGLHFYLYFLFSYKVRSGFLSLLAMFRRKVWRRVNKNKNGILGGSGSSSSPNGYGKRRKKDSVLSGTILTAVTSGGGGGMRGSGEEREMMRNSEF